MSIFAWIVVGFVAGIIAKMIVPGTDPGGSGIMGIVITTAIGIAGALVGGFLAVALGISNGIDDFDIGTVFLAVVGAILLLLAYKAIFRGRSLHA
ncbi:MAG TPA: GlsB/YeaQ/YmgE family stress response membrane protein [Dehalococcoidia bacterium]